MLDKEQTEIIAALQRGETVRLVPADGFGCPLRVSHRTDNGIAHFRVETDAGKLLRRLVGSVDAYPNIMAFSDSVLAR